LSVCCQRERSASPRRVSSPLPLLVGEGERLGDLHPFSWHCATASSPIGIPSFSGAGPYFSSVSAITFIQVSSRSRQSARESDFSAPPAERVVRSRPASVMERSKERRRGKDAMLASHTQHLGFDNRGLVRPRRVWRFPPGPAPTEPPSSTARLSLSGWFAFTVTGGDLWVMRRDGSERHQVTTSGDGVDISPTWAPNASRIAFRHSTGAGGGQRVTDTIRIVQADGTGERHLVDGSLMAIQSIISLGVLVVVVSRVINILPS
jgi:hypothetical protein